MTDKRRILKVTLIAVLSLFLTFALLFAAFIIFLNSEYLGFYNIDHMMIGDNSRIYIYSTGHSSCKIKQIERDAVAPRGDGMLPINGDLGEYVVRVRLCDTVASGRSEYEEWTTYKLDESGFSFMYVADISTHAVDIYIGSNEPVDINDISVIGISG